jgi:hypothetical protein
VAHPQTYEHIMSVHRPILWGGSSTNRPAHTVCPLSPFMGWFINENTTT